MRIARVSFESWLFSFHVVKLSHDSRIEIESIARCIVTRNVCNCRLDCGYDNVTRNFRRKAKTELRDSV